MMVNYSVVIPVYNGEMTISTLVGQIQNYFNKSGVSYQLVLVYDCGTDQSWEELKSLKKKSPIEITLVHLTRNFGQHNALIAGIKHSKGKFIITMDDDLQHDPNDISTLIVEQKKGDYDVVYGKYKRLNHSFFRNQTSKILKKILHFSVPDLHRDYTSFRLIKSEIALQTLGMNNSYTFLDGYLSWVTRNVGSVEVTHSKRAAGQSSYTINRLLSHSVNIFVTFSNLPIRFVTFSSIIILILSTIYSVYLVVRKLVLNDLVAGYASYMVAIGFGIGFILFSIGIVGEYIYRINLKTTRRPNFIEKEVL